MNRLSKEGIAFTYGENRKCLFGHWDAESGWDPPQPHDEAEHEEDPHISELHDGWFAFGREGG